MAGDKNEYILSINGMSKSFGRNKVLKHISFGEYSDEGHSGKT